MEVGTEGGDKEDTRDACLYRTCSSIFILPRERVTKSERKNSGGGKEFRWEVTHSESDTTKNIQKVFYLKLLCEFREVKSRMMFNCSKTCGTHTPFSSSSYVKNVICHFCSNFCLFSKFLSTFLLNK